MSKKMFRKLCIIFLVLILTSLLPFMAWAGSWAHVFETSLPTVGDGAVICEENALWMWGNNSRLERFRPERFMENVASFSRGDGHNMAIRTDGTLWGWGGNWYGQLGDGTTTSRQAPVLIMDDVATVVAGRANTFAIRTDGSLWAWGNNENGQIGDGTQTIAEWRTIWDDGEVVSLHVDNERHLPVRIKEGVTQVIATSITSTHETTSDWVFAITYDGGLYSWGSHCWDGRLGIGIQPNSDLITHFDSHMPAISVPIRILNNVSYIASSGSALFAIQTDGTLWAWGFNWNGRLGDGTEATHNHPVKILDNVVYVASSLEGGHTMAIRADGSLWGWGFNGSGQLGDGTTSTRFAPVRIMGGVADVSVGAHYTMAVRTDGSLWGWGSNRRGLLGIGTATSVEIREGWFMPWEYVLEDNDSHSPVHIMDDVASVFTFEHHAMAIRTNGTLWAWGDNTLGRIGDGTTTTGQWVSGEGRDWDYWGEGEWSSVYEILINNDRHSPVEIFQGAVPPPRQRVPLPFHDLTGQEALPEIRLPEFLLSPEIEPEPEPKPEPIPERDPDPRTIAAMEEVYEILTALSPEERDCEDALSDIANAINDIMRRESTYIVGGNVVLHFYTVSDAYRLDRELRQGINAMLYAEGFSHIPILNIVPLIYDARGRELYFDNSASVILSTRGSSSRHYVTVKSDFANIRIAHENIPSAGLEMRLVTMELSDISSGGTSGNAGGYGAAYVNGAHVNGSSRNSSRLSPLTLFVRFWAAHAFILLVLLWMLLQRNGKKFRMWVIPAFTVVFVATNILTINLFSTPGGDSALQTSPQTPQGVDAVSLTLRFSHSWESTLRGATTLSLPIGDRSPDDLVVINETGDIVDSWFNPVTHTMDFYVRADGTFALMQRQYI